MVVAQGHAYSHAMSLRLTSSIYEYINLNKSNLFNYDNIVINTYDFANKIDYSLISNKYNVLNTYYGAQTFEDWGLNAMSKQLLGKKNIIIASDGIEYFQNTIKINFYVKIGYNKHSHKQIYLPLNNSYVIDFDKVFYGKKISNLIYD